MKKYLIDQAAFLLCGIGIMIGIPFLWGPVSTVILETIAVLAWGFNCRRLLLLPLDLLRGKEMKTVYPGRQIYIEKYEFFKDRYSCVWVFYYGNNQTLELLVPVAVTEAELLEMKQPFGDEKVNITYYRFSKILCHWESA